MSDPIRTFIHGDVALDKLTTRFSDFFHVQGDFPSPLIRAARLIENIVLALLATAVAGFVIHTTAEAFKPGLLIGLSIGIGSALAGHQIRQSFLLDTRVTHEFHPYTNPFTSLHLDAFSLLKGKWQILEATAAALVGIAVLGASLRLSQIHPFATALFAAIAVGATTSYLVVDWCIGRSLRQI